jgi:hypothetical protein
MQRYCYALRPGQVVAKEEFRSRNAGAAPGVAQSWSASRIGCLWSPGPAARPVALVRLIRSTVASREAPVPNRIRRVYVRRLAGALRLVPLTALLAGARRLVAAAARRPPTTGAAASCF